jgi:hypothetical protein
VPDYVEAFPNDVSYLPAADGSQLAISNGHKIFPYVSFKGACASAMYALMKTAQALVLNLPVIYAVLDTTLSSKLKLPVDCQRSKYQPFPEESSRQGNASEMTSTTMR